MRSGSPGDLAAVRQIFADAFAPDPLLRWIFPDDRHRLDATAAWLGLFVEGYLTSGRIDVEEVDGQPAAAAMWRMPSTPPLAVPPLPSILGLLAALIGTERARLVGTGLSALARGWPPEPFAYLHFLAVSPAHQRTGLGRRVVVPGLDAAAAAGLGVELETTNPANLAFDRTLGFEVTRELTLEPDGPPAWAMWRPPPR